MEIFPAGVVLADRTEAVMRTVVSTGKHLGQIEVADDGSATLYYPGFSPQRYRSRNAAFNRRRWIESARPTKDRPDAFTPEEDARIRAIWGKVPKGDYTKLLPGRTYFAIKAYCKRRKIRVEKKITIWTPAEIRIVLENDRDAAFEILKASKTRRQVGMLACRLGSKVRKIGKPWTDPELVLMRQIDKASEILRTRYGRTGAAIEQKRRSAAAYDRRMADTMAAVQAATARLPDAVRRDVEGDLLVQLLSREITVSELLGAVRKAVTRAWGPHHLSLDAPLSDGSGMTWIDTIADDRPHF